jgi:AcrR family transcriptional regulator
MRITIRFSELSSQSFDARFDCVARGAKEAARKARTEVYRQHVLEAAERVLAEHGFEATKVQQIAEAAGVSMGTIYSVFPGKQELYDAILAEHGARILALVREVHGRGAPALETLDALITLYVDYFVTHPDFLRLHLRSRASWALGPSTESTSRLEHWQEVHGLQADIFRRGVESGAFVQEDPDYLAKLFSVMDQVLLADWVARGMRDERAALAERFHAQARRSFAA